MEKLESENSLKCNGRDSVQFCQFCGETQDNASSMISPAASLQSRNSSGSCCSDFSVDANSDGRVYVDECSTDSSQEDSSSTTWIRRDAELAGTVNSEGPKDSKTEIYDDEAVTSCNSEFDGQFWLPPQPVAQDDDIEGSIANYDDDDDECGDGQSWGRPDSLISFGEEGFGSYKFKEERLKALEDVMNRKLKALVSDLLKSVGVTTSEKEDDNWVDIITSLAWEAASFVKPDATEGKMDPIECVKIKCISTGSRNQSHFVRGLVFKKHAAHKHMPSKYNKPRLLLIQGALGLSSSELSSFESMQQQEKESAKSILDMIERYQPNVVLVENTVSRDIQESVLKKGLTLVFDMKQHRLEKVARCTASLSADILVSQKLRQCDSFYFKKFVEEHSASGDTGKKPSKTLMFIEGCPTRLGCTILLMGSNSEELKKVKNVAKDAITVAYNLILETSFFLDQKAMFSTLPFSQEVNLTLGNETPSVSAGQGIFSNAEKHVGETRSSSTVDIPIFDGSHEEISHKLDTESDSALYETYHPVVLSGLSSITSSVRRIMGDNFPLFFTSPQSMSSYFSFNGALKDDQVQPDIHVSNVSDLPNHCDSETKVGSDEMKDCQRERHHTPLVSLEENSELLISAEKLEDEEHMKDDMASPLDSESILVLMSRRNASRGTMCEHNRFSRIKFYRNFDIPLEKFLQDNLLNKKQCKTCGESPEAHIFHYAHHNKVLTIQVRCLPMDKSLPGEREGKLWMWSRCGKCKSQNGSSLSSKRVLISTASRSFSFGKFLELSFSNSSFFSRLSACGHSFDKDFFYFFGLGQMVAMFKYSTVTTYAVFLPPKKLEFSSSVKGAFLKQDFDDVYMKGTTMFLDVEKAVRSVESSVGTALNLQGSVKDFSEIEKMLKEERSQFEVAMQNAINDGSEDIVVYKLLSLNRIRQELLLESCVWDRRLQSLLSSYNMDGDPKVINPKQSTLPDIKTISHKQQQAQSSVEGDANEPEDSSAEENSVMEATAESSGEFLNHNCDLKLNLVSKEASGSLIVEIPIDANVSGFREQNKSLMSSAFTEINELSNAAKITGNGSTIEDPAVNNNCLRSGDENKLQSNLPLPTHLQSEKQSLTGADVRAASDSMDSQSARSLASVLSNIENDKGLWAPFPEIRREYMKNLQGGYLTKLGSISTYAVETAAYKLVTDEGAKLHIPLGSDKYIVSDYEDEISSIIACALALLKDLPVACEDLGDDGRKDRGMDGKAYESSQGLMRLFSLTSHFSSSSSLDLEGIHSSQVSEQTRSSSLDGLDMLKTLVSFAAVHPEVSMGLGKLPGKRKYSVICIYASQFCHLRARCCPSEVDYIASLSRCRKWDAKGGKSKSLFAKTLDDRFIIKEIKRTEFDSFLKFGPSYFEYMEQCYEKGNQTCLAKVLGIYQVTVRPTKSGKETRHDLMVMENLSFGRNITRQYDLKGALHARFNSADNTAGDVLLDQNFVIDMNMSPLYVGTRSKWNLERAAWNDSGFLNSVNVMDYSLLVGVDTQRRELVCGIIDYLRQYTWDKQLENWVKSSLVVPKNQLPTVISPKDYKKRFRKFIDTHFLTVPEYWCSQRPSNPCILCGIRGSSASAESLAEGEEGAHT